jgi:membrane protease YdiL (CAAX protease family)
MPFALLVATVVGNTVPFVICARACGIKVGEIFARPKVSAQTTALFGTVAIGASIFVSIFVGILESLLKYVHLKLTTPAFVIPWSSPAGTVAVILAVVIIAPLTEEFICRGVLLRAFRRYGDVFAVVASSLVWALLHGNFVQGIPVFCMGIIFGMLALKSDSIIPTFIIHSVNNILSLIDSSAAQNSIVSKLFSGSFNIVLLFTAIVLYCVFFNQFRIKRNGSPARGFAAFFTSVPVIIFILVCAALTIMSIKPL